MELHFIRILLITAPFPTVLGTPVFLWQASVNEKPVFPQIKKDDFLTEITPLVESKMVVAFTYQKLCLKDFQCESCFPYLSQQTPSFIYANVETPTMDLKSFNKTEELSVGADGTLATPIKCETDKLYIISLERLKGSSNPMKSCDDAIQKITTTLACPDAVYMFMGTTDPSATIEPSGQLCQFKNVSIYLAGLEVHDASKVEKKYTIKDIDVIEGDVTELTIQLKTNENASLAFNLKLKNNYFVIKYFQFDSVEYSATELHAPQANSYSCGRLVLRSDEQKLVLKKLQIQYSKHKKSTHFHFLDAWTCEGFITPAIISAIFVTVILISILSCGICMLLDVQTPSKFDPALGPYITINASE